MRSKLFFVLAILLMTGYTIFSRLSFNKATAESYSGTLLKPAEAVVDLSHPALNQIDEENKAALLRYFASTPRWEVGLDKNNAPFAVKREKNYKGGYFSALNGYYTKHDLSEPLSNDDYFQTRALISFDNIYGYGNKKDLITHSAVGDNPVLLTVETPYSGTPGYSSYLVAKANSVNMEIYEQSSSVERKLTAKIYNEISEEIAEVIKNIEQIKKTGLLPETSPHYSAPAINSFLNVYTSWRTKEEDLKSDFLQYGIYTLSGALCPKASGQVYAKAVNLNDNSFLSEITVRNSSRRIIGWSEEGKACFPYESEIIIGEGGWNTRHHVRIELWHIADSDKSETKLAEITKTVAGYQF